MSPELFKCFVHELSEQLNSLEGVDVPILNSERITHLLWADDLVLLSLTPIGLQKMLNVLYSYCTDWGLSVNMEKTAVMVFNRSGRLLNESRAFYYGETPIAPTRQYTYLGVVFTLTGSLSKAQSNLRQRALRAYFSLKSLIDLNSLKKNIIFKLFDALVLPVVSYGCNVWLPYTNLIKDLGANGELSLGKIAQDPLERVQLSFLKWTMSVGKYTSNAAIWGDTGRCPLGIELVGQVYNYFDRLEQMDKDGSPALVRHAFAEQKLQNMCWYNRLKQLHEKLGNLPGEVPESPLAIKKALKEMFIGKWEADRHENAKLGFYNAVKKNFCCEQYLCMDLNSNQSKRIAQIRSSSHRFNIEAGRHGSAKRSNILHRLCYQCGDEATIELLAELPFFEPIKEDELHVLRHCPMYNDLRDQLSEKTKTSLLNDDLTSLFEDRRMTQDIAKMLVRVDVRRFPKKTGINGR